MGQHSSKHHTHGNKGASIQRSPYSPRQVANNQEPARTTPKHNLFNFAAITVLFNPIGFQNRYDLYRKFAEHMSQCNVNLITVECIFESAERFGLPRQHFQITQAGNPQHIQIVAPSILWLKENLINIAISRLPSNIEYVAWLDADIEFERRDWADLAIAELQNYTIVQLFELAYFLGPTGKNDILRRDYSFGYSIRKNKPIDPKHYAEWYPHPGYGWAMRRSAMTFIGGLLDFCIIGSADLHFAFALLNRINETLPSNLHDDYKQLANAWGTLVAEAAQYGRSVSYVPTNIWHYWHGDRDDRNYVNRWSIITNYQFSPRNDLEKNDATGLIRLVPHNHIRDPDGLARIENFERDIVNYFKSRNEDKTKKNAPLQRPAAPKNQPNVRPTPKAPSGGGIRNTPFRPTYTKPGAPLHIWSSGHTGTHVDDHNPYWDQCCCPGHHHHPDNHDCPCSPHHMDDQQCYDHHHHDDHHHDDHHHDDHHHDDHHHDDHHHDDHHHDDHHHDDHHHDDHHHDDHHHDDHHHDDHHHDDHHHDDHHHDDHHHDDHHHDDHHHDDHHHDDYHHDDHHHDDHHHDDYHHDDHHHDDYHHHHDDHHHHHDDWGHNDNSGFTYDTSYGGGGFSSTDYSGPGSFY